MAHSGGKWLLQLLRGARKLEAIEWLQEGYMPILASGSRATQPAKSAAMVSLRVAHRSLQKDNLRNPDVLLVFDIAHCHHFAITYASEPLLTGSRMTN
jgi:hypothetical protein